MKGGRQLKYIMFVVLMLGTACMILISGFTLPTVIALMVLVLAVASDFLTTLACLKKRGKEGNPVIAFLLKKMGVLETFGLMAGIWTCLIVFRWLPATEGIQTAVAFTYWLVPVNNLIVLRRLNGASRKSHAMQ